jgi:hypothetical protein
MIKEKVILLIIMKILKQEKFLILFLQDQLIIIIVYQIKEIIIFLLDMKFHMRNLILEIIETIY